MFSLPQSPSADAQIEPIQMAENSRVLNIILRLCYPLRQRVVDDLTLEDVHGALHAALKYDIPAAEEAMRTCLLDFVTEYPLRVYAIACILQLQLEAKLAAEEVVRQDVAFGSYIDEFEDLPAGCYYRLLNFNQAPTGSDIEFIWPPTSSGTSPRFRDHLTISEPEWADAGAPFDRQDADVTIASRDFVRFRVHSVIISISSPVLADMLLNPQPFPSEDFRQDALLQDTPKYIALSDQVVDSVVVGRLARQRRERP